MKKEQARRWLSQKLKTQQQITLGSAAALAGLGAIAWALELTLAVLVLRIGFLPGTLTALLTALAMLGTVQYLTLLRLQSNLGDVRALQKISEASSSEYSTPQPLSAVWMYAFGSMDSDQFWYEKLLAILCMPQRLWNAAWFSWKRTAELKQLNCDSTAAIIRHLFREAELVEVDELTSKLNLPNPVRAIREVSLIDGVILLTRKSTGLNLAPRLVDELNDWLKNDANNSTASNPA